MRILITLNKCIHQSTVLDYVRNITIYQISEASKIIKVKVYDDM